MIIGLNGYAGVGKDTLANYIRQVDPQFRIKKFSGKLKIIAEILTGIPADNFESQEFKHRNLDGWDMTVRELLQKLGTDAIRDNLHEDAWVNALFVDYHQTDKWIITDMRFPNEFEAVKQFGGITIRLNRPGVAPVNNHPSETGLDAFKFDYTYNNQDSASAWHQYAVEIINNVKSK